MSKSVKNKIRSSTVGIIVGEIYFSVRNNLVWEIFDRDGVSLAIIGEVEDE